MDATPKKVRKQSKRRRPTAGRSGPTKRTAAGSASENSTHDASGKTSNPLPLNVLHDIMSAANRILGVARRLDAAIRKADCQPEVLADALKCKDKAFEIRETLDKAAKRHSLAKMRRAFALENEFNDMVVKLYLSARVRCQKYVDEILPMVRDHVEMMYTSCGKSDLPPTVRAWLNAPEGRERRIYCAVDPKNYDARVHLGDLIGQNFRAEIIEGRYVGVDLYDPAGEEDEEDIFVDAEEGDFVLPNVAAQLRQDVGLKAATANSKTGFSLYNMILSPFITLYNMLLKAIQLVAFMSLEAIKLMGRLLNVALNLALVAARYGWSILEVLSSIGVLSIIMTIWQISGVITAMMAGGNMMCIMGVFVILHVFCRSKVLRDALDFLPFGAGYRMQAFLDRFSWIFAACFLLFSFINGRILEQFGTAAKVANTTAPAPAVVQYLTLIGRGAHGTAQIGYHQSKNMLPTAAAAVKNFVGAAYKYGGWKGGATAAFVVTSSVASPGGRRAVVSAIGKSASLAYEAVQSLGSSNGDDIAVVALAQANEQMARRSFSGKAKDLLKNTFMNIALLFGVAAVIVIGAFVISSGKEGTDFSVMLLEWLNLQFDSRLVQEMYKALTTGTLLNMFR